LNRLLDGVRVLELGNFISGPYTGQLLAEMGAQVVKIEKPEGGDPFRSFSKNLLSPQFCAYNRGKRSITLDLNKPAGRDLLLRLVDRFDVLVENFRPDVMDRLGVGWAVLHARNPRLIYCNISGFGPDGPSAKRPAYDTVAQSMSGFFSQLLDPDRPRIAGPAIADAVSGLYAAFGIASALVSRARDGVGHRLDVPMVEVMAAFSADPVTQYLADGRAPGPYDRASVSQSFALRCADDKLIGLHLSSPPKFWEALLTAMERPDIGRDSRFCERRGRIKNFDALCNGRSGCASTMCRTRRSTILARSSTIRRSCISAPFSRRAIRNSDRCAACRGRYGVTARAKCRRCRRQRWASIPSKNCGAPSLPTTRLRCCAPQARSDAVTRRLPDHPRDPAVEHPHC
jgi:crotonobetainyl-CoA:carnitine CoA-transferase CaiB-like acyl-CoA transferase